MTGLQLVSEGSWTLVTGASSYDMILNNWWAVTVTGGATRGGTCGSCRQESCCTTSLQWLSSTTGTRRPSATTSATRKTFSGQYLESAAHSPLATAALADSCLVPAWTCIRPVSWSPPVNGRAEVGRARPTSESGRQRLSSHSMSSAWGSSR